MRRTTLQVIYFLSIFIPVKLSCQPPDVPFGGSYVPQQPRYLPGDRVLYTCKDKFTRIGRESRSCQSFGKWSGSTPFCDTPTKVKNPRASSDDQRSASMVVDGSPHTCFFSRNSTGQWLQVFIEEPNPVDLIRLHLPKGNVKLQITTSYRGSSSPCAPYDRDLEENQWIQLDCLESRTPADSVRISEISSRANVLSVCEIEVYVKDDVWCENPPVTFIPNGYLEVSREKAVLKCARGYTTGENSRLVCDRNNTWTGPNLVCNEILCDLVSENSSGADWHLEGKQTIVGSRKVLRCPEPEFQVTGEPNTVTCREDGTWTPTTAKCTRKQDNKRLLKIIGISVGAVVVFVMFLCLGLTLYCIHKKGKQVVVVYSSGDDLSASHPEAEYSSIYYEKIPAPGRGLPRTPADVTFGTLKSSTLYGK